MIPDEYTAKALWDTYHLSEKKRVHSELVAQYASALGKFMQEKGVICNEHLLYIAGLLHDIDKEMVKLPSDKHPDAGVRLLREKGFSEVADVIQTHPLHKILDKTTAPTTIEQQLLFLSDKIVKDAVIGVDERFSRWKKEDLDKEAQHILDQAYEKVKALEANIFSCIGKHWSDVIQLDKKPGFSMNEKKEADI